MSQATIEGKQYSIWDIFSTSYIFTIPNFQRPYAWTTVQAGELLEDLLIFMGEGNNEIKTLPPYFLGSIVLIKGKDPNAQVVDGQQRLTTLAILISVLRSLELSEKRAAALAQMLYQEEIIFANIPPSYRLTLRTRDNFFFQHYICHTGGIKELKELKQPLSDSQKNIQENAMLFLKHLEGLSEQQRVRLTQFILTQCFMIVVSASDSDSAYRIFSVLNDRGLDLSPTDILKAEIIGEIPQRQQDSYTAKWEEMEALLGRDLFQSLFVYIRTIKRKVKSKDTILKEFRQYVNPSSNPQQFIDKVLHPYADALYDIKHQAYQSIADATKVNNTLDWLNKIDNSDWLPPAIFYYTLHENDHDKLLRFFTDLERLAAGLMMLHANVNQRIERYASLLTTIENNEDLYASDSPLQLTNREQKDIIAALNGNLYEWGYCKYVLLRLDEALSDGGATYDHSIISIEHVLPQNPAANSEWTATFPDEAKREEYVHCLGNLVLLSRKKNAEAQNFDFRKKINTYFKQKGVVKFVLTVQVLNEDTWTPLVVERRQKQLVNKLQDIWRLS